jgi:subtilase family serine protease
MRRRLHAALIAGSLTCAAVVALPGTPALALTPQSLGRLGSVAVCGNAAPGAASCDAHAISGLDGRPLASVSYGAGYGPADLASAYGDTLPASGSAWTWNGQTVAIVDAYSNPNVASDLAAYRAQFKLPPCTAASGCFTELNESGAASPLPAGNTGWGEEIDLDVEMVSAVCPDCRILLMAGSSTSLTDLGTSVNTAASKGANAISNSYGASEFSSESTYGNAYYNNHPGIAITASAGDGGYGVEFPAVSHNVTAVGGTSLVKSSGTTRGWSETVWSSTGSGCSAYISQPSFQTAVAPAGCSGRIVGDVAAVADPNTGVAVYDSYGSSGGANWYVFGGTSVASPIIASFYALANAASGTVGFTYNERPYAHATSLNDVTSGSNGSCTSRLGRHGSSGAAFLCTGEVGYDGPTGMGTPKGLGAF